MLLTYGPLAEAATVRGVVSTPGSRQKPPARYVTRGAQDTDGQKTKAALNIAVALEPIDNPAPPDAPSDTFVMAQENTAFVPNLLVVPVGTTVSFPNYDAFFHNVFSYSPPRNFDLGRYPKGETRTVTFEDPGIVRLFCEIHASMYASIAVVNTNWYKIVSAETEFVFENIPAGRYRLLAVDAHGRRNSREISVTNNTESIAMMLE